MKKFLLAGAVFLAASAGIPAQPSGEFAPGGRERLLSPRNSPAGEGTLTLRRLSLYASGVGFFEYLGNPPPGRGEAVFTLHFRLSEVNDALKSLMVILPPRGGPHDVSVTYPGLSSGAAAFPWSGGNPGIAEILGGLRGEEVELRAPAPIRGRILAVEYRPGPEGEAAREVFLSLLGEAGISLVNLKDVSAVSFPSERVNAAFRDALDRIREGRNDGGRELRVGISGNVSGPVRISYVVPVPVWKVSYRLDMSASGGQSAAGGGQSSAGGQPSGGEALLQGWAIVDNDGDTDWEGVELSLVSGRPVSFIQNLHAPYHVPRPTLPLSIAGVAEARAYDGALAESAQVPLPRRGGAPALAYDAEEEAPARSARPAPMEGGGFSGGTGAAPAARGAELAEQFRFTLAGPVTVPRRRSAMIPLVEGPVSARKVLIFSGGGARGGRAVHPAVGAELTNTTGMKLPAGPLAVYDGGSYAGDALVEFFPDGDRRFISWGEDLSVSGAAASSETRTVSAATVSGGVMTLTRRQIHETVYTIRNGSPEGKFLVLEHPRTPGTSLAEPGDPLESTASAYRFGGTLPGGGGLTLSVKEERPLSEQIALGRLGVDSLVLYAADREIPAAVRTALERAVELRRAVEAARNGYAALESKQARLGSEQERTRRNLEAAGNQSPQGQEYLRRLGLQDAEFDSLAREMAEAEAGLRSAQGDYETYLGSLRL